jgi:iron complex transport system substrate-binding protein
VRVVSLCPSLTETVFALGRGDTLVGRTKFCIHPAAEVARVERVGGTKNPKIERIVALAPDLVLMNDEENRREDAEALAAAGVRTLSSLPLDPAGAAAAVRTLAVALGAAAAGERLAADIEARAARVHAARAGAPPVRFAYLIWRAPWMAVGAGTYVHGLLALAGGANVLAGRAERYPEISLAELAAVDPERVFLSSEPFPFAERHADELAAATGLARARFECVDGELLSWHGARTPAGLDYAARLLLRPA